MAFKMKGFEPHNMYKTEKAETHKEHLALKEKGYDHSPYNKRGMWDNIHAKRKRGESPAKPGDPDRPSAKEWNKNTK
tara:strand:- start:100 stop:330 length:231 start_codon:yes stop_codon:yes gene_type:complete